ncbi:hypothetical protein ABKN59_009246 [Abortiporus biennis]
MFSTLSSFLPPALQPNAQEYKQTPPQDSEPQPHPSTTSQDEERPQSSDMAVDEQAVKKRKERTHESFIVVRPPPSKSNHPLNLQVQLVPPSTRDHSRSLSSRRSFDSTAESTTEDGAALSRTSSSRSDISMYSGYSSVTSFSTVASSTSSSTSTRRMIIPLYNLQAHNVLTNVIVDAGTDAKIAKFLRRGLEVIGLAMLEPIEVWPGASFDSGLDQLQLQPQVSVASAEPAHTPTSSALSLDSDTPGSHGAPPTITASPNPPSERSGARRLFGKIFKKRGGGSEQTSPNPQPVQLPAQEPIRTSKRSSLLFASPPSNPATPTHSQFPSANADNTSPTILQPSILGIQPMLQSPIVPPKGRHPKAYVWVVRRWLKGLVGPVEVRFEWTRSSNKSRSRTRRDKDRRRESLGLPSNTPSTSSLQQHPSQQIPQPITSSTLTAEPKAIKRRKSRDVKETKDRPSLRSVSPNPPPSTNTVNTSTEDDHSPSRRTSKGRGRQSEDDDDGEDSDPEDSETPWSCTLILRSHQPRTVVSPIANGGQPPPLQEVKVKVGAVVPTPHHPKVVALLKIPFPLPDIEVEKAIVRKRIVTPAGVARPAPSVPPVPPLPNTPPASPFNGANKPKAALILTAEEIKDIVSCTSLWLVVREGFGGVGKEKRKGDGWRIRG